MNPISLLHWSQVNLVKIFLFFGIFAILKPMLPYIAFFIYSVNLASAYALAPLAHESTAIIVSKMIYFFFITVLYIAVYHLFNPNK